MTKKIFIIKTSFILILLLVLLTNSYSQDIYSYVYDYNRRIMYNKTMKMTGDLLRHEPEEKILYIPFTLWVKGSDKFKLETDTNIVYRFNNALWIYDKENNKAYLYDYSSTIYHLIMHIYLIDDDADTMSIEDVYYKDNKEIMQINLYYIDESKDYWKIEHHIDNQRSIPYKTSFYKREGEIYSYKISEFISNITLYDSFFIFFEEDYPEVELIDMTNNN